VDAISCFVIKKLIIAERFFLTVCFFAQRVSLKDILMRFIIFFPSSVALSPFLPALICQSFKYRPPGSLACLFLRFWLEQSTLSLSFSPCSHTAVITSSGCSHGLIFRRDALHLWCTLNYTLHRWGTLHIVTAIDLKKDRAHRNGCQARSFFFSSNLPLQRLEISASSVNIVTLIVAFG